MPPALLPETIWMFLEALHQKFKLFRLGGMHPLMDRVQDLLGLFNHGQCGSDRRIRLAFSDHHFRSPANAHAGV